MIEEILTRGKEVIALELPNYGELDYNYALENNECRGKEDRYGFTPSSAIFIEGRQLGFTTIDQTFIITLVNSYNNNGDDVRQRASLNVLYADMLKLITAFNKRPFTLLSPQNKILLVSGATIDEPEFIDDNSTAVLRASLLIRYYFKI